ncbi:hypothetical protein AB4851_03040 [Burkholderia sp. 22PA0099]|uniref:hypothetical protein n=1 Tax=Burkholderia sp. 22PA0099 TaxID=3237372 RepID=UPI0039C2D223
MAGIEPEIGGVAEIAAHVQREIVRGADVACAGQRLGVERQIARRTDPAARVRERRCRADRDITIRGHIADLAAVVVHAGRVDRDGCTAQFAALRVAQRVGRDIEYAVTGDFSSVRDCVARAKGRRAGPRVADLAACVIDRCGIERYRAVRADPAALIQDRATGRSDE